MATSTSGLKGNPASKRIGNKNRIARRAACYARGVARKKARNEAQFNAEARNRASGTSPWAEACKARQSRRSAIK